jgi:uncharacterized protein
VTVSRPAQPHFPGRAAIEAYGAGGFRFAGMSHKGSILALPSGIWAWPAATPADIDEQSLARVLAEPAVDLLVIGTGRDLVPLAPTLRARLKARGMAVEVLPTASAASTYNILLGEDRRVAAALLAAE